MTVAPLVAKKIAIWVCAITAYGAVPAAPMLVRKVCGFFGTPLGLVVASTGFNAYARSLRKYVARSARSPARRMAEVVGLGTVTSPLANWKITGLAAWPRGGFLAMLAA